MSEVFSNTLLFSKKIGDKDFEKWIKLELNGYFDTNPVLANDDVVPEYRTVTGLYYDLFGRPLIIENPEANFVSNLRLRNSVSELEALKEKGGHIKIISPEHNNLIKVFFGIYVYYFSFHYSFIVRILDNIKVNLIEELVKKEIPHSIEVNIISEIQNLIINDNLLAALKILEDYLPDFKNEIIIHRATLNDLEKSNRIGIVSEADLQIKKIRLRANILELADKI